MKMWWNIAKHRKESEGVILQDLIIMNELIIENILLNLKHIYPYSLKWSHVHNQGHKCWDTRQRKEELTEFYKIWNTNILFIEMFKYCDPQLTVSVPLALLHRIVMSLLRMSLQNNWSLYIWDSLLNIPQFSSSFNLRHL
jgi:hypothetical protein